MPLTALAAESVVPKEIDGIPTDVVEVGKVHSLAGLAQAQEVEYPDVPLAQRREKWRPAHPGVSIGHYKITAGTFGAVVIDRRTKKNRCCFPTTTFSPIPLAAAAGTEERKREIRFCSQAASMAEPAKT